MRKLTLLLTTIAVGTTLAQKQISMPTEKGSITLLMDNLSLGRYNDATLEGAIRNDTPFRVSYLMFELVGYNASNVDIKACGSIAGCWFHIFDPIDSGSSVRLRSPGNFIMLRSLKPDEIVRSEFHVRELSYFIKYDILSAPVVNEKFTITPTFTVNGVGLDIRNTSVDVLEIAWDQSVYIDEDGNSSRLIRGNVNLAEKDRPQPNTVIPPGTKLQETVFPVDRIKQEDGKWKQIPLLPEIARIFDDQRQKEQARYREEHRLPASDIYHPRTKMLAGKEVRLFLRLLVNDQKQNVTITFKIAEMIQ